MSTTAIGNHELRHIAPILLMFGVKYMGEFFGLISAVLDKCYLFKRSTANTKVQNCYGAISHCALEALNTIRGHILYTTVSASHLTVKEVVGELWDFEG